MCRLYGRASESTQNKCKTIKYLADLNVFFAGWLVLLVILCNLICLWLSGSRSLSPSFLFPSLSVSLSICLCFVFSFSHSFSLHLSHSRCLFFTLIASFSCLLLHSSPSLLHFRSPALTTPALILPLSLTSALPFVTNTIGCAGNCE